MKCFLFKVSLKPFLFSLLPLIFVLACFIAQFIFMHVYLGQFYSSFYAQSMFGCQNQGFHFCFVSLLVCFWVGVLNIPARVCHKHTYEGQILCMWESACICKPLSTYANYCLKALTQVFALFRLFVSYVLPLFKPFSHVYMYLSLYFTCFIFCLSLICQIRVFFHFDAINMHSHVHT